MAQASQVQANFQFVQGLITEASPLTYPENATIDEANFELEISGKRQRRLGIDYETNYQYVNSGYDFSNPLASYKTQTYRWDNVNNDPTVSIIIVRVGGELKAFDAFEDSLSANEISILTSIPITDNNDVSFTDIDGDLIVTGAGIPGFYILEYNSTANTIDIDSNGLYPIEVRDLWGVDDGLGIDERPTSLSTEHQYNLRNQGWTQARINNFAKIDFTTWAASTQYGVGAQRVPITPNGFYYEAITSSTGTALGTTGGTEPTWPTVIGSTVVDNELTWECKAQTTGGQYPSNADLISLGEKTDGGWDSDLIKDYLLGSTQAPRGKFILNLFQLGYDRNTELGTTSLNNEYIQSGGINACTSYAGRLFIAGVSGTTIGGDSRSPTKAGMVLFSQVLKNKEDLNKFYQDADPTSDEINELIATDAQTAPFP